MAAVAATLSIFVAAHRHLCNIVDSRNSIEPATEHMLRRNTTMMSTTCPEQAPTGEFLSLLVAPAVLPATTTLTVATVGVIWQVRVESSSSWVMILVVDWQTTIEWWKPHPRTNTVRAHVGEKIRSTLDSPMYCCHDTVHCSFYATAFASSRAFALRLM